MLSRDRLPRNCVKKRRQRRGWSQDHLATAAGVSRSAVSAIEIGRLVPSVAAALALARALDCTVEDLFGGPGNEPSEEAWAWALTIDQRRFWRARVGSRVLRYPTEATVAGVLPHDGLLRHGAAELLRDVSPDQTLVMASCDPAAGLLASEYERATGYRMLPLHRSSCASLELLRQGVVHVAGIHLATIDDEAANASAARTVLGDGFAMMRFATWDEGLAIQPEIPVRSIRAVVRDNLRWIGRENGAAARQCQNEILGKQRVPRRIARDHWGVAEAIRCGWADIGVCLRLVSEQAGLTFLHVRDEAYDFCFPHSLVSDVRFKKLLELIRSPGLRALFDALPGYELARTFESRSL